MLPPAHRLRRSSEFASVVRAGRRARRGTVVVHQLSPLPPGDQPARVGLVVGRSVGGSVVRSRVSRRLRAVMAARLSALPPGSATVVRALPESAQAGSPVLAADVDAALSRLSRPVGAGR